MNSEKERLSIATFYSPKYDSVVGPLASSITEQHPAQFSRVGTKEYFAGIFGRKLEGKSYIDVMRVKHDD